MRSKEDEPRPRGRDEHAEVPTEAKLLLTLEEAARYTGIGINAFREISHDPDFADEVVCVVGKRRLFRRTRLEEYVDSWRGCEL